MRSKPHRKFSEGTVTGLSVVCADALASPRCSLETARLNASHPRVKPNIQKDIARLRAQADVIARPAVLALIEEHCWLARVVRANLALLDPKIDGDLLVSLHLDKVRKNHRVRKIRVPDKILAINPDTRLAGGLNLSIFRRRSTHRLNPARSRTALAASSAHDCPWNILSH
jgi:hypothetical protein